MGDFDVSERRITVGDLSFNVADVGTGPPIVMLHGWPDSWHLWSSQMQALAERGYRVIAPDLRGFGESDKPDEVEQYSIVHSVGDVAGIMDALDIERAVVVGHDFGAALAWVFTSFLPDRVVKLATVSVGHPAAFASAGLRQRELSWYMMWFQFPGVAEEGLAENDWELFRRWAYGGIERGEDPHAERQIADLSRPGALTAGFNWYRANIAPATFHRDHSTFDFPQIACPTMGVWSRGDMALTEEQMTGSERYVSGSWRYERIEDVDHWVPVHASEQLTALLLDFIQD